jgi:hypothetical protein
MTDDTEAAYARVRAATEKVDRAWEGRLTAPNELRSALDELNEAGLALTRALAS